MIPWVSNTFEICIYDIEVYTIDDKVHLLLYINDFNGKSQILVLCSLYGVI